MQEDTLQKLISDICGEASGGEYHVGDGDRLTVYFGTQGAMETVDEVVRIRVGKGYLALGTRGEETFWIGLERIVAMKTIHRARGGAGF